jgi:hypothetical protein
MSSNVLIPADVVVKLVAALDKFPFPSNSVSMQNFRMNQSQGAAGVSVGLGRNFFTQKHPVVNRFARLDVTNEVIKLLLPYIKTPFSNIQINKNFPGRLHVDKNNIGLSTMITVGKGCEGGALWIYGRLHPTLNRSITFDGHKPHMTLPYTGTRYSLVFFSHNHVTQAPPATLRELKSFGFNVKRLEKDPPGGGDVLDRARQLALQQIRNGMMDNVMRDRVGGVPHRRRVPVPVRLLSGGCPRRSGTTTPIGGAGTPRGGT